MNETRLLLKPSLERLGCSSITDLLIGRPTLNLLTAAQLLGGEIAKWLPVQVGEALRDECSERGDDHFWARVTLFTTFTGFEEKGWTERHWMRFGVWSGLLGDGKKEAALKAWDYLKSLDLAEGWQPSSIFDSNLEKAVEQGFRDTYELRKNDTAESK